MGKLKQPRPFVSSRGARFFHRRNDTNFALCGRDSFRRDVGAGDAGVTPTGDRRGSEAQGQLATDGSDQVYAFSGAAQSWVSTLRSTASRIACTAKPSSKVGPELTPLPIPCSRS